jgi:hypothetical protein
VSRELVRTILWVWSRPEPVRGLLPPPEPPAPGGRLKNCLKWLCIAAAIFGLGFWIGCAYRNARILEDYYLVPRGNVRSVIGK